jgi:hypothetical protein
MYKPWVFHSSNNSEVIVVDPNVQTIFRISLDNPASFNDPTNFIPIPINSQPVSVLLNRQTNVLYVGVSGQDLTMRGCIHMTFIFCHPHPFLSISSPICCPNTMHVPFLAYAKLMLFFFISQSYIGI